MSGPGHSLSQQIINEIKAAYALFVKQLACNAVSIQIDTQVKVSRVTLQPNDHVIPPLSHPPTQQIHPPSPQEVSLQSVIQHGKLLAYQNPLSCHSIQPSFPSHISQNLALQHPQISAQSILTDWQDYPLKYLPKESLQFKHVSHSLDTQAFSRHPKSHSFPLLSKKVKQVQANGLAKRIPWQKASTPIHRFSSALQKQFTEALAKQAQKPSHDILLKKVYARVELDCFVRLSQDKKGNLICHPKVGPINKSAPDHTTSRSKENLTFADTVNSPSERTCYLIFGTCLSSGETVSAKLFLSDKELSQ